MGSKGKKGASKRKDKSTDKQKALFEALNDNSKPKLTVAQAKEKIKQLDLEAKKKDEVFLLTYKAERRNADTDRKSAIAHALGKQLVTVSGRDFYVKKSYLKGLKDPVKYIEGLYARTLRHEQKKAFKDRNFNSVVNIAKKLNKLDKQQGLTSYKIKKAQNLVASNIEKVFPGLTLDKQTKMRLTKNIKTEKYYISIITYDRKQVKIDYV